MTHSLQPFRRGIVDQLERVMPQFFRTVGPEHGDIEFMFQAEAMNTGWEVGLIRPAVADHQEPE